jgi:hypothetical protein
MDPNTQALLMGAAGAAEDKLYIEDTFSTYLYTGNGSTQTITNGIDLAGEGGLVWQKARNTTWSNALFDTVRGVASRLVTDSTIAASNTNNGVTAFNSNGFSIGANAFSNNSGDTYASWTFRKAAKFFDVVTYTGNGSNRTIAHNLGSVPGCIIVKRTDTTGAWQVYHRANTAAPETDYLVLNTTAATADSDTRWNDTLPTSTVFSLGTDATVNASGGTYVAYLFAHDAGGFGDSGSDNVISCGSYTGNGSATGPVVTLGWEPQWLLIKRSSSGTQGWIILDNMRGLVAGGDDAVLAANVTNAEVLTTWVTPLSTGFQLAADASQINGNDATYIYIAIRRGPMKTPTDATKVFSAVTSSVDKPVQSTGFPVDLGFGRDLRSGESNYFVDRLRGGAAYLASNSTGAESIFSGSFISLLDSNTSWQFSAYAATTQKVLHAFRRAPGFFDVVAYTGTGANQTVSHNLGVVPELIIFRGRTGASSSWWTPFGFKNSSHSAMYLESDGGAIAGLDFFIYGDSNYFQSKPTSSSMSIGSNGDFNASAKPYIAYLFATCPGVSKVFDFTGTGTTLQIDCGFTNGARLVLIKRTDSTGDWYIWDSARGIISGNDPYLLLNSTAAEVTNTDYIDPYSAGFEISSTAPAAINASGGSYIGLAIA